MNNNLELIYWTNNGGVKLPLEDWQYKVIAQVLGLSIQEDKNGNITFSHFPIQAREASFPVLWTPYG